MIDDRGLPSEVALPAIDGFRDALNTAFQVHVDDMRTVELTLTALDHADRHPGWESFSLLFLGPDEPFPQATYVVEHESLGSFALFLVPIRCDGPGQGYEAVFNRPSS